MNKTKTSKGKNIIIRYPQMGDMEAMWRYINILSKEKTFLRFQGEEITLEEEKQFLTSQLEKIAKKQAILLLAFHDDKLVGVAGIDMQDKVESHTGLFGISVLKEYRGEGIGSLLTKYCLDEAKKNIPELEIITLCVFSTNQAGLEMYKKEGFIEYGRLPKGIKLDDKYVDHIQMYKLIS